MQSEKQPASQSNVTKLAIEPRIFPRAEHIISRANISDNALKVLYRLKNAGYKAYVVGGGVRDLLLGREPKDFDVVTDARPEQVRELFRNCRLIGRRFLLAHVRFGREIVEVSTFRAPHEAEPNGDGRVVGGRIVRDNVYGGLDDDVWRRDFTVNALYYNIADFTVVDYVGGVADIKAGQLRLIGDPARRYAEDPVRMLRAIRFAVQLGFTIHPDTSAPIYELGYLLTEIPPSRLSDEVMKLFLNGFALQTFEQLRHYSLFGHLFPQTEGCLSEEEGRFPHMFLVHALKNTDARVAENKSVTPAFLFASLLWDPLRRLASEYRANGLNEFESIQLASDTVISRQVRRMAIPRIVTKITREIWALQLRFERSSGMRPLRLIRHPCLRAAYDFLLLRAEAGEGVGAPAKWWTAFLEADEAERGALLEELPGGRRERSRRRRRKVITDQ
ncbi:MAG: polynucleotide adenylyltransferase PcnB [Gammaproteobacteria bacterium]|nr:polynucleotide adenylyltransferase PcnB [Gammaproteobacteria bacterium]MCI0591310.1 polynucleotide adenylyltransferase PcnB [Gammaproteobacteria bacterium]